MAPKFLGIWQRSRSSRTASARRGRPAARRRGHAGVERLETRSLLAGLVNSVPGAQTAYVDTYQFGNYFISRPLAFTAAQGNGISVSHDTIGTNELQVTLSVDAGTLTLVHPNPNGGIRYSTGDGYQDATMVFVGTLADVNTALSWVGYTPPATQFFQWDPSAGGNGHWYQFVSASKTWAEAKAAAEAAGGYLATVTSAGENTFVNSLSYDPAVNFWLGGYQDRTSLTYSEPAGGWRWVTNEPWSYTSWNAGDPSNSGGSEDHLVGNWSSSGKWADGQGTNALPAYVVEFNVDPRPAPRTLATLTITTDDLAYAGARQTDTDTVAINLQALPGFAPAPNYSTNPAAFDTTFGTNGVVTVDVGGGIDYVTDMRVMPDGKIVAVGAVNNRVGLLRFNADGTLDTTFGPNGNGGVQVDLGNGVVPIEMQFDNAGRIVVLTSQNILRFTADGVPDTTWGVDGNAAIVSGSHGAVSLRVTPEDTYVVGVRYSSYYHFGWFQIYGDRGQKLQDVYKTYPDGGYDLEQAAVVAADGSIVVIGSDTNTVVANSYRPFNTGYQSTQKFSTNLSLAFEVRSTLTLPDGRILLVGSSNNDFFVCRLLRDGRLDTTFGTNGVSRVNVLNAADEGWRAAVAADGKIVVTGYGYNGVNNDICVVRMSYDGVLDQSFGSAGLKWLNLEADDRGYAVAVLPDGKILIGGQKGTDLAFVRLLGDGINPNGPSGITLTASPVPETAAVGTVVGTFAGTDATPGDTLTFTLVAGTGSTDNALFTIDPAGQLLVNGALDFETKSQLSIRVRATDGSGLWFEKAFSVDVSNMNEAPAAPALSASSIAENSPVGSVVGTLSATDPDAGDTVSFSLAAGTGDTDNGAFTIVGNSLRTAVAIDVQTTSSYSIRVRATDGGGLFADQTFTITVTNVNEIPQDITLSNTTVSEAIPVSTAIGILGTVDPDAGDTFTYSLAAGQGDVDNAAFVIVGNQLRSAGGFDYETKPQLQVRVRSTDQGGLWVEKAFTIDLTDAQPEPPKAITLGANTVAENQPAGTLVGTLSSTDDDAGDTFTYTLVSGSGDTDNGLFQIVGGDLQTKAALDYEAGAVRTVRVRSTDSFGLFSERSFQITVTDVNDAPTSIALSNAKILEGAAVNSIVGMLSTVDQDAGETFVYTLVVGAGDTDNADFKIVGSQLQVAKSPTATPLTRTVRMRATDQGGLWVEKAFTITVDNRPDAPTDVLLTPGTINENMPVGAVVGTLSAVDPDLVGSHSFALVAGTGATDNSLFAISGDKLIARRTFNYELKNQYSIRVRATDESGLFVSKVLTVFVTDVNEAPTRIVMAAAPVTENQPAGTLVGTLAATDPDAGDTVTYTLVRGTGDTDNALFDIVGNQVTTKGPFDYEARSTYSFRVRATDGGGAAAETAFTVVVKNLPDVLPSAPSLLRSTVRFDATNRAVSLSWVAPASSGDSPIQDYVVEYSSDGGTSWTTFRDGVSPTRSATVTGLGNGAQYVFRVAAKNTAGVGPSSGTVAVLTPDFRPNAPVSLVATNPSKTQVRLLWTAPRANGGSAIQRYVIEYNDGSGWTTFDNSSSPTATSATLTGLTSGKRYIFRVAALNAAGQGAFISRSMLVS